MIRINTCEFGRRALRIAATLMMCAAVMAWHTDAHADDATPKTLMIVHLPDLAESAADWARYRASESGGGWQTVLFAVPELQDITGLRLKIRDAIRQEFHQRAHSDQEFAVLLLGDTEVAIAKTKSQHIGIPAWYFQQNDSVMRSWDGSDDEYASDHPYRLMDDDDDNPDIALGRIPARSADEARAVLAKLRRYEAPPTVEQLMRGDRARLTYTAGEGRFGVMDGVLEELFKMMVDRMVPEAFDFSVLYAKASSIYCPPPSRLTESVLQQLTGGSLLFNYVGHGHDTGFDSLHWHNQRIPILNVSHLRQAADVQHQAEGKTVNNLLPIVFTSCCSTGYFDLPGGTRSMAEEMLFNDRFGGIAIIAGSRITHPYANTATQMHITKSLLVDREPTVGSMHLRAMRGLTGRGAIDRQLDGIAQPIARSGKWETTLPELRRMHVRMYNLLGDPATRIAHPKKNMTLTLNDRQVTGLIDGMTEGRVRVWMQTIRTSMVHPDRVQTPLGDNDADLETKAAQNMAIVNDRVIAEMTAEVRDGSFAITLDAIPTNAATLRAYAAGVDQHGAAFDALGAARLAPQP